MSDRPSKIPDAWPTDGRSKIKNSDSGVIITHPERTPMIFKDGRWVDDTAGQTVAA